MILGRLGSKIAVGQEGKMCNFHWFLQSIVASGVYPGEGGGGGADPPLDARPTAGRPMHLVYIYIYIYVQCATRVKPPPCQELRIGAVN